MFLPDEQTISSAVAVRGGAQMGHHWSQPTHDRPRMIRLSSMILVDFSTRQSVAPQFSWVASDLEGDTSTRTFSESFSARYIPPEPTSERWTHFNGSAGFVGGLSYLFCAPTSPPGKW